MHRHVRSVLAWSLSCAFALGGVALPMPSQAAGNPVTDVSYGKQNGSFRLSVTAAGAVSTRVLRLAVDARHDLQDLVIDVSPASYDGKTKVIGFSSGQLRQVRVGQLSETPAVLRIVVESQGAPKYDLKDGAAKRSLTLDVQTSQVAFALPPDQAAQAARTAAASSESAMDASTAEALAEPPAASAPAAAPAASKPASSKPAPAPKPKVAQTKPQMVAVAAVSKPVQAAPAQSRPAVVAEATPNPWLPGGKYYCKVPGRRRAATGAVAPAGFESAPGPSAGVATTHPGNVSLDVKNADIVDVLKLLSQQSGQNIITTQNVKGTTTVSLHDVPLKQALDLIVRSNGLDYRQVGNVYVVGTPDDLSKQFGSTGQAAQTVAFPIKYAKPDDLAKQLATVIPTNAFTIDPRTDTLLVTGPPAIIQSARNFLALSDIPAPQVVFEVKVVDITKNNDSVNAGVNFTGSSVFDLFENRADGAQVTVPPTFASGNRMSPQPFTRNALFVQTTINYLITHNEAQLLASPRLAALDNQAASLLVGQTYPIVYFDSRSGQFQVQYIDIGVKLNITPVINTDGYITATMHTERSVVTGLVQNQFPIINNRKADSVLRVKDGDTIVMGGMLDDEETKTLAKVPLLGDIPILGALFRNVNKTKLHNEVVFLITPHIIAEKQ